MKKAYTRPHVQLLEHFEKMRLHALRLLNCFHDSDRAEFAEWTMGQPRSVHDILKDADLRILRIKGLRGELQAEVSERAA